MKYCQEYVSRGRAVLSHCSSKAGYGPKGQYCRVHARRYSTQPAVRVLWMASGWQNAPQVVKVRSIGKKTFIDERGRINKLASRSGIYYRSRQEAVEHIRRRLSQELRSAMIRVKEASKALDEFNQRYPKE